MIKLISRLLFICLIVQLCSCGAISEEKDMVEYNTGSYYNKNWDDTVGTYSGDVISNKDSAIDIASAIYSNIDKSSECKNYVPQNIFYDADDGIWIVSFWKENAENEAGGECSIALQRKDGKVLRIWFGE